MAKKEQIQGYLFEVIVRLLMEQAGYRFDRRPASFLPGRGSQHQIDAFGLSGFATPFVHSLRLLAEAKYRQVELSDVRGFYGVIQDISQNYFSGGRRNIGRFLFGNRYTDMGVMFCARGFTEEALRFAFAHNIFIVSYAENPFMKTIVDQFEGFCDYLDFDSLSSCKTSEYCISFYKLIKQDRRTNRDFFEHFVVQPGSFSSFKQAINNLRQTFENTSSVIAFILGVYPVHLLSLRISLKRDLLKLFSDSDQKDMALHYHELDKDILFSIEVPEAQFEIYFTLPRVLFEQYLRADRRKMLGAKLKYVRYIDIPLTEELGRRRKVSRSLRLNYSRELTQQRFR